MKTKLFETWMRFGRALGDFQARILLVLIFFIVLLPIGLIWRILKIDPLNRSLQPKVDSYFVEPEDVGNIVWDRTF